MTEVVTPPPAKKRRWRKPPTPITTADSVNHEQECRKAAVSGSNDLSDYLHPEMLSDTDLVQRLSEYHVPMDSNCSREELLELYSKHVMPKPQRKRKRRGQQFQENKVAVTAESTATAPHNNDSTATTPCNDKWLTDSASRSTGSKDGVVTTKRKQSDDPSPPHRKKAFIRNDITWP